MLYDIRWKIRNAVWQLIDIKYKKKYWNLNSNKNES